MVVLFGGVAFAQDCASWALQITNENEENGHANGDDCYTPEEYQNSICGYYNACMSMGG